MKNYFYTDKVAEKIRTILNEKLYEDAAKVINIGDFSILPGPDDLKDYLPAILINITNEEIIDGNEALGIYTQQYNYDIYYIRPYDYKAFTEIPIDSMKVVKEIANILMNYPTLDNFSIDPTDKEVGGEVLWGAISTIDHDTVENEFFRNLQIPAYIEKIEYFLAFKNYQGR